MLRQFIGAAAVAALCLVPRTFEPASAGQTDWTREVDRQPIFIHDVSGETIMAPVQSTVLVWSNGDVCFSWKSFDGEFGVGNMTLSAEAVQSLVTALEAAEAWTLPDQWPQIVDLPLQTVTVLDPTTNARAHTFSYWFGWGDYAAIGAVVDRLEREIHRVR